MISDKLGKILAKSVETDPLPRVEAFDALSDPLTSELLRSLLLWESGQAAAVASMKRLAEAVIDANELRICLPEEIAPQLGASARATETAQRLRMVLAEVYTREHATSIASMESMGKRDAKAYLESIDGIPPFVVARVLLLGLGGHAFPIDDRLALQLAGSGMIDEGVEAVELSSQLEREIRAGDALGSYLALEEWASTAPAPKKKPAAKKSAAKPASKKPASKKKPAAKPASKKPASKKKPAAKKTAKQSKATKKAASKPTPRKKTSKKK